MNLISDTATHWLRILTFRYVIMLVLFVSCSRSLDRNSYIQWVRDYSHGLHVEQKYSEYIFDVQYQPSDYILLQRGELPSDVKQKDNVNEVSAIQHYIFSVRMADQSLDFMDFNVRDTEEKQRKLYYFSYLFQNDIVLEENGNVLPCVLYHFERSADLKNYYTVVLGFENPDKNSKEATFVVKSEMFSSLPVKIKISKDNIPSLAI
jgi:hypothetical protein